MLSARPDREAATGATWQKGENEMVRVIVAVVLASIVHFAWGFAYHGPLSAMKHMTTPTPDETAVAGSLSSTLHETGTYVVPMCPGCSATDLERKAHEERAAAGPIAVVHYRKEGFTMAEMPVMMGTGFAHLVLTGLLAAVLLRLALPGLSSYLARVGFVFGLGLFAAVGTRLGDMIWLHHHWTFAVGQFLFAGSAWLLSGIVMAAIIRPDAQHALALKTQPRSTSAA
jgi:hypothetical protein